MLKKSNNPEDDLENIKKVYPILRRAISDSNASDERLWVGMLLNNECWAYSNTRWKKGGWKVSTVKDRLFFGQHPRTRNALARLFWIGRLTFDENNTVDPWKYTEFVCTNQRYIEDMLGRNTSDNIQLVKACADACIEFTIENEGIHGISQR